MDPQANLDDQITLAQAIQSAGERFAGIQGMDDAGELEAFVDNAHNLAALVLALHGWRESGGFDPYNPKRQAL